MTAAWMLIARFGLHEIIHKGVIRARVKTTQVAVSVETKRSRPLSDEEREFLAEYLEEPK